MIESQKTLHQKLSILEYPQNEFFEILDQKVRVTKKSFTCQMVSGISDDIPKHLQKFYKKRHFLFKKFNEGILLDEESWYSVIPEVMSSYIANKLKISSPESDVVDGFCGSGGLAIQLAQLFKTVICIDIDPIKINNITKNLQVYQSIARVIQMNFLDIVIITKTLSLLCVHPGINCSISLGEDSITDEILSFNLLIYCIKQIEIKQVDLSKQFFRKMRIERNYILLPLYLHKPYDLNNMKPSLQELLTKGLQMTDKIVLQLPKNIDLLQLVTDRKSSFNFLFYDLKQFQIIHKWLFSIEVFTKYIQLQYIQQCNRQTQTKTQALRN